MPRVIVAGAGPVGCVSAAVLRSMDVDVVLLEAEDTLPRQLRASTFHPATLELLEPFGVVDAMVERGLIAKRFAYRERHRGVVAAFDLETIADVTRFPFRLQCEQYKLCEILLDRLVPGGLDVRFGAAVANARDLGDGAEVTLTTGETLQADAVIAADGASSAIRKSLDLAFDGMTYADRYVVVSTPFEIADHLDDLAYVNYISDSDEWLVLLRTVDLWRALFPVGPDETDDEALSDEHCERRLQGVVSRPERYEIGHRTIYRVHQRVAERFRVGRILLAGDAAHINNPLGGMGMNGGVHDAILLAGGIGTVLRGSLDESRLDHYADLRRTLALEFVQRHTHQNAVTLATSDAAIRRKALDEMAERASDPDAARAYVLQASMITAVQQMRDELLEIGAYPFA